MDGFAQSLNNSDMASETPHALTGRLPTFFLYGEQGRSAQTDWLHCESIAARSRLHDWEIRPHRHEALFQILNIRCGRAEVSLDGQTRAVAGPCVITVPALAVHGFRFASNIDGTVVTVLERHVGALLQREPTLAQRLLRPQWVALAPAAAAPLQAAVATLQAEFNSTADWRALAIDAALLRLLLLLGRTLPSLAATMRAAGDAATVPSGSRGLAHVQRFRALVEQRFREQPALVDCAHELGVSATQLNRVCQQVLGHSALGVLHGRTVLEAQRELTYTTLSVKHIALGLGFTDAGYFTRFFQRETGRTPSAWRHSASARI